MKVQSIDEYRQIGSEFKSIRKEMFKLYELIKNKKHVCDLDEAIKIIDKLRSGLEDDMSKEFPMEYKSDIFYNV